MKKVLVTGASGFIGSNLCNLLHSKGFEIIALYHKNKPPFSFSKARLVQANLLSRNSQNFFTNHNIDAVVHAAAINPLAGKIQKSETFIFNKIATEKVLENFLSYCQKNNDAKLSKKFINLSTYEVYGECSKNTGFDEFASLNPQSKYAESKAKSHQLVSGIKNSYCEFINLVCSNNYGPLQNNKKLIPQIFTNILNKQPIKIYGNGTSVRSWTYVLDTCHAILKLLEKGKTGTYHICSGEEISVNELINCVSDSMIRKNLISDVKSEALYQPALYNPHFKINCSNTIKELNWSPKVSLNEGIGRVINHLSSLP